MPEREALTVTKYRRFGSGIRLCTDIQPRASAIRSYADLQARVCECQGCAIIRHSGLAFDRTCAKISGGYCGSSFSTTRPADA